MRSGKPQTRPSRRHDPRDLFILIGAFPVKRPHRARPCRITGPTPNDVNMHLPDLVSNAGHIEFFRLKMIRDELRNTAHRSHHLIVASRLQLMQIFNPFLYFRN